MINWLVKKIADPLADESINALMTNDYAQNPLVLLTAAQKLGLAALVEAGMRAQTGKEIGRPLGSPVVLSPWSQILFSPRQLFQLPTPSTSQISTTAVVGPDAKKPLTLEIPVMITAMSYGGSLSLQMKMALAKGAAMAGTSTNTGESAVTDEERNAAKYLVGQYNRGGWLTSAEQLRRVDAIEVQLGQGAWGGAVESTKQAATMEEHLREAWHLKEDQDATVRARMPGVHAPSDIVDLVKNLKRTYEVPVGIKIAGSDYIEYELEVAALAGVDFLTIDGSEGGTAIAPVTLEDDVGLPTLHSLVRTVDWLIANGLKDRCSVIATGGLSTPGHFLKALALGATAVSIGSIAVMAALHDQLEKTVPQSTALQLALYNGVNVDKLDIDQAALSVANFLKSCTVEMKLAAQAVGKCSLSELSRDDLVTVDRDLAEFAGIRYAGSHRAKRR